MTPSIELKAIKMAKFFHNTYETLAPYYNYETKEETRYFDQNSNNGKLMIAVCMEWILNNKYKTYK